MPSNNFELSLLSIKSASEHLETTLRRALDRLERQSELKNGELLNQVKERKAIARALQLDRCLYLIYEKLSDNPELALSEQSSVPAALSTAVKTISADTNTLRFEINGNSYRLHYIDKGAEAFIYDDLSFGSTEIVFEVLGASDEYERVYSSYIAHASSEKKGGRRRTDKSKLENSDITSFRPGNWVYDIVHAVQTLEVNARLKTVDSKYSDEALEDLRHRFGI